MDQEQKSDALRALHRSFFVLANAWDPPSARIFERAGFAAIGTTSAGCAFTLGYPDGQIVTREEMIEIVARIARSVNLPVTADVESGYKDAAETARQVWKAGAVGMNFEDNDEAGGVFDLDVQVAAIREIRSATPKMVINARTDIILDGIGDASTRFNRAVERMNAYLEAGADCVFAPGVRDRETIGKLTKAVRGPLNILATAGAPDMNEMRSLGVARVSVGSGPMRATLGLVDRIARELHDQGTFKSMTDGAIPYDEVNRLLAKDV